MHPSASSCFLLFFYFSFPPYKKCQKNSGKNIGKISVQEASRRARVGPEGSQGGPGGHPARPHPWPRQGGVWGPWSTSGCTFAYLFSVTGKLQKKNPIPQTRLCSAAAALSRSGAPEDHFPAPCRREDWPPGVSSPPWMLPGCLVSSFPWTMGPWSVAMWCSPPLFVLHGLDLVSCPTWSRHICNLSAVSMLSLMGSDGLWDYVQIVIE